MRLNFADTDEPKEGGFELLPNGKYHCQVTSVEETETGENAKEPGTPMLKMEYTVMSGKYEGRKIWDNLVLGDSSLWKTKALLYAIGYTKEEVASPDFDFQPEEMFMERELTISLGRQPAKDGYEARNKVNSYSAPPMEDGVV